MTPALRLQVHRAVADRLAARLELAPGGDVFRRALRLRGPAFLALLGEVRAEVLRELDAIPTTTQAQGSETC